MNEKLDIDVKTLRPFTKFIYTIGELPTSYLMSMTYEEQLVWLCNYLTQTVIPTINNNAEAVKEVQDLVLELQEYINNYFDNLDVQEEINNKLDKMVEDGTFDTIINQELFSEMNTQIQTNTEDIEEINYYKLPHGTATEIEAFINERMGIGHVFYADGLYELDRAITIYPNKMYDFVGTETEDSTYERHISRMNTIKIIGTGSEETIFKATDNNSLFNPTTLQENHHNISFEFENISFVGDDYNNTPFTLTKDNSRTYRLRFTNCNFNKWNYGFYYNASVGTESFRGRFATFNNCYFTDNTYGIYVSQDNVMLNECRIEYNTTIGLIIAGSHIFNMNGGKIQYNGTYSGNGNQVTINTGSYSINFNGVYFEPTSSSDYTVNINTAPVALLKSGSASVIENVNFINCRCNGIGSSQFIYCGENTVIYGIHLNNIEITNFRMNDNKELIVCDGVSSLTDCYVSGNAIGNYNLSGTSITNNDLIPTSMSTAKNVVNNLKYNIITAPINNGSNMIIAGSVSGNASQKYFNGEHFTVTKEDTGTYLITLDVTNKGGSNTTYFPVIATSQNTSNHCICTVESVSASSFRIRTISNATATTDTLVDTGFRFIAVISI